MMGLKIKPGVQMYGIQPEATVVMFIAAETYDNYHYDCVVTSIVGKKHGQYSLHPPGFALDLRTKHLEGEGVKRSIVSALKDSLPFCDVVLEHLDQEQEHIHIEFDPKDDPRFMADKGEYRETLSWPR
jgi:hypothetical protein